MVRNHPVDVISVCSAGGEIRPLRLRTDSHASSAENTFPRCILPLGLGANRPVSISFRSFPENRRQGLPCRLHDYN